jgi:hypothetical protein
MWSYTLGYQHNTGGKRRSVACRPGGTDNETEHCREQHHAVPDYPIFSLSPAIIRTATACRFGDLMFLTAIGYCDCPYFEVKFVEKKIAYTII